MKVGRCVKVEQGFESMLEDPRYLGCSTNVLDVVSRHCSGRSECQLRVSDQTFDDVNSCYTSLKMYLEVSYMCISGELILILIQTSFSFFEDERCHKMLPWNDTWLLQSIKLFLYDIFIFYTIRVQQYYYDKIKYRPNQFNRCGMDEIRNMIMTKATDNTAII